MGAEYPLFGGCTTVAVVAHVLEVHRGTMTHFKDLGSLLGQDILFRRLDDPYMCPLRTGGCEEPY